MLWVRHESAVEAGDAQQRLLAVRRAGGAGGGRAGRAAAGAVIHGAELPRVGYQLPKRLPGEVLSQWIDPANLALLDERDRTLVLVLAFTGLSGLERGHADARRARAGSDGQPYLRYFNVKRQPRGDAADPAAARRAAAAPGGVPGRALPGGHRVAVSLAALHRGTPSAARFTSTPARSAWWSSATCARPRSAPPTGELALDVHPHLFRHHLGTSMVNENIPLTVIQEVLDHGSIEMTARYARLRDETVRQAVKRWHERVNIRGERIALPVDGPLEQAAWMKERIARAKQALPNGYCGLPLVQSCPHPNACLSCESFLTDGSFRAVHEQHQAETRRLLEKARKNNNLRLIEVLERDEQSLTRILEGLDAIEADHAERRGARPARSRRAATTEGA